MNLRKATKKELITEIRNLRHWKECAQQNIQELKRRDAATAKYKQLMPDILQYATSLAIVAVTKANKGKWWDCFWEAQDYHDEFWNDRKAEKISEYSLEIEQILDAAQKEEIIEIKINPKMYEIYGDNQ